MTTVNYANALETKRSKISLCRLHQRWNVRFSEWTRSKDGWLRKKNLIPLALTGLDHLFRITIDMFSPPPPSLPHMNMPRTLRTFLNINNDDEIESMRIKTKNDRNKK